MKSGERGVALLLVLWVMDVLLALALSLSYLTRTNMVSTLSFKEGAERKFTAEAGLSRAIAELFYARAFSERRITEGPEYWRQDGTLYDVRTGGGPCRVRIIDESGKVDINFASDIILKNLLLNLGATAETADVIMDSIMDWRDEDDLYRLNGAETAYYMSLEKPYRAKNADFDSTAELLLIRGMTPELLYGEEVRGLSEFVTVFSKGARINVNAAPKEVLMSIPEVASETADKIIAYRRDKTVQELGELRVILGDKFGIFSNYATVQGSSAYSIDSFGASGKGAATQSISAVVRLEDGWFRYVQYKEPGAALR